MYFRINIDKHRFVFLIASNYVLKTLTHCRVKYQKKKYDRFTSILAFLYKLVIIKQLCKSLINDMALTAALKSGPCLCDASATCPRICPPNLGTSYFKDKVTQHMHVFNPIIIFYNNALIYNLIFFFSLYHFIVIPKGL